MLDFAAVGKECLSVCCEERIKNFEAIVPIRSARRLAKLIAGLAMLCGHRCLHSQFFVVHAGFVDETSHPVESDNRDSSDQHIFLGGDPP